MGLSENSNTDFRNCGFGMALSGGGYRASLFHLGALRRLNEINWINRIERITSVSGGSLLLGYLFAHYSEIFDKEVPAIANQEWQSNVSDKVHVFVKNDLRTIQSLQNLTINLLIRRDKRLDSTIGRLTKLYGMSKFSDFPYSENGRWPEIYVLATDIVNGQAFRFSNNPRESANSSVGLCDLSFFPLATACAISASFPPIFGPAILGREIKRIGQDNVSDTRFKKLSDIALVDGGLYDNLGINLIAGTNKPFVRLFSDAGNPYKPKKAGTGSPAVLLKYMQLMSSIIGRLNFKQVRQIKANDYALWSAQFSQEHADPAILGFLPETIDDYFQYVRTDLDLFTDDEAKILENHGYAQTELALRNEFGPAYQALDIEPAKIPYCEPKYTTTENVTEVLTTARKRKLFRQLFDLGLKT